MLAEKLANGRTRQGALSPRQRAQQFKKARRELCTLMP